MIGIILLLIIITTIIVSNYSAMHKNSIATYQTVVTRCQNGYYDNKTTDGFNKDEYCSCFDIAL